MPDKTRYDLLSVQVDSAETKFVNSTVIGTLKAIAPDGTIVFDTNEATIPGILNTTSSQALTASYANILNQNVIISGNLSVTGTTYLNNIVVVTSSYSSGSTIFGDALTDTHRFTGSVFITNSLSLTGQFRQIGDYIHTGSVYHSGSKFLNGIFSQTGSMSITGSTTQIGNNTLLGNTTLSGSVIISGALGQPNPTISIFGDLNQTGYTRYLPVTNNLDTSLSASYIFVSGSTQDLYFSQNSKGYNNVTRLRWLEGNLYTGIFNGGLITTQSSTVYQVGSGSGVIVNLNASFNDNPYPIVQYINWNNLSASIAPLSASFDQSFVAINSSATINVQGNPYDNGQYNTLIPIGIVLHQNNSTINGVQTFPSVAYGWKQRSFDFIKAFGPLKISGYTLSPSSSLELLLSGGVSWVDGRNYTIDPNNPSYITEATGITTSKIFRYHQSGSEFVYDTNGGIGYTNIDPTQYSLNGTLTAVPGTGANRKWSIQRVYYFPNSATKALFVYYGSAIYDSQTAAIAGILTEIDLEAPNTLANAIYVGALVLRNNATFTDATSYAIQAGGLFRQSGVGGGSGGGGGTTNPGGLTTQIQYNNGGIFDGVPTLTYNGATLLATGSFNGPLQGTASWATNATNATNAAFANGATYANQIYIAENTSPGTYSIPVYPDGGFDGNNTLLNANISYEFSTQALTVNNITASNGLFGTSSWAINALTASFVPNYVITASVSSNIITFTKGDGSTFPITVNTGSGGGGGTPGGSVNEIQYNNGTGGFAGAANIEISTAGNLNLIATTDPATPSAGVLTMYSKTIAGRTVPKVKGPSSLDYPLQSALWQNAVYMWSTTGATAGLWINTAGAGAGTFAATSPTTSGGTAYTIQKRSRYSNAATTTNQVLGQRNTDSIFFRGAAAGQGGFFFYTRCGFDTWTNGGRFFAGMATATTVVSADPSLLNNTVGFCVDTADNGAISFLTRGTAATKQATGLTITTGKGYDIFIFCKPNDTSISYRIIDLITSTEYSNTATLNLPTNTTALTANVLASNAALTPVNSIQLGISKIYIETDY